MEKKEIEYHTIKFLIDDIGWANAKIIEIEKYNNTWRIVAEAYENKGLSKKMSFYYSIVVSEHFHIISIDRIQQYF